MQNVSATDKLLWRSTAWAWDVEEITCTTAWRALLDDADNSAQRTTLWLWSIATQNSNSVSITGWSISWITDLAIADWWTGWSTKTVAFDNLAPTTTQWDIIYHNWSDNVRLAKWTADQVLTMNAWATAPEWQTPSWGGWNSICTYAHALNTWVSDTNSYYWAPWLDSSLWIEAYFSVVPVDCTIKNLFIYIYEFNWTTNWNFILRKNWVDTALNITFGTTWIFSDTSEVSFSAWDKISYRFYNNSWWTLWSKKIFWSWFEVVV
jgi:hypothetical protein